MEYDVKYYEQVANELRSSGLIEGLWLKALAVANADKEKSKSILYSVARRTNSDG